MISRLWFRCVSANDPDFDLFRDYLERTCGIVLGDNKQYLVTSRLGRLLTQRGIRSLGELVRQVQQQPASGLREMVVDAMTTNETLWFRDGYPFELLKSRLIPEFLASNPNGRLRIWSAACSSGQEPYSLSMAVDEFERANPGRLRGGVQIVASEISAGMLNAARAACYDSLAMAGACPASAGTVTLMRPVRGSGPSSRPSAVGWSFASSICWTATASWGASISCSAAMSSSISRPM